MNDIRIIIRKLRYVLRLCCTLAISVTVTGCVQNSASVEGSPQRMNAEEAKVIDAHDRLFKMLGRNKIRLRTISDGESAIAFGVVVDDILQRNKMTLKDLDLSKYHVLYGDRGNESIVYFSIRADSHDKIGVKNSDGEFVKQITNYPYIEYWVNRNTWEVIAGTGLSF